MIRNLLIFLGTFTAGALIALVARAALLDPHAAHEAGATGGGDYAPMVTNTLAPAGRTDTKPAPAAGEHAGHGAAQETARADGHAGHGVARPTARAEGAEGKPVNTVCAICGMDVDPKIPAATYQGKTIGFGCKLCPPKFAKDPERWGPLFLRNEVAKR